MRHAVASVPQAEEAHAVAGEVATKGPVGLPGEVEVVVQVAVHLDRDEVGRVLGACLGRGRKVVRRAHGELVLDDALAELGAEGMVQVEDEVHGGRDRVEVPVWGRGVAGLEREVGVHGEVQGGVGAGLGEESPAHVNAPAARGAQRHATADGEAVGELTLETELAQELRVAVRAARDGADGLEADINLWVLNCTQN